MGTTSGFTHNARVYFNTDPFDTSLAKATVFQAAIADGYLHGLYMAGHFSKEFFLKGSELIYSVRQSINGLQMTLENRGLHELYDRAMTYMQPSFSAMTSKRLDAFLTGYQIGLHRATQPRISAHSPARPHPAMFLTGENLRNYAYGELIEAEDRFLHTMQVGNDAYQANVAICREDLPPDERG